MKVPARFDRGLVVQQRIIRFDRDGVAQRASDKSEKQMCDFHTYISQLRGRLNANTNTNTNTRDKSNPFNRAQSKLAAIS